MTLSRDERELLDLLRSEHNLDINEDNFSEYLSEFNQLLFTLRSEHSRRLSEQNIDYIPEVEAGGGGIGAALGAIVGVALSFTGIGLGVLTLVTIGASVGFQIGSMIDPPSLQAQKDNRSNKEKQARNAYGFDSVSSLVTYGEPIPAIYCNADENPNGGVRTTGYLINQRVDTRNGAQRLYQLYAICSGPIGSIDESQTLFDNQSLSTFFRNEIEQEFRLGYPDQSPLTDFPNYSNCVSLSANQTVGVDLRSLVESVKIKRKDILAEPQRMVNGFDATRRTKSIDFRKNGGTVAEFTSEEALRVRAGKSDSGFVEATILRPNFPHIIGMTTVIDPPNSGYTNIPFAFRLNGDNTCHVRVNGVNVHNVGTIGRNTSLAIEYLGRSVYFRVNKNVVYTSNVAPVYPVRLCVQIFDGGSGGDADGVQVNKLYFGRNISYAKGRIRPSDTTVIEVDEDDIEKFSASDIYRVRGRQFQIVGKNTTANTITVDGVLNLREDDRIYAIWEASFETSRKVNRIDVNLATRLWARNYRGELIRHGIVFDVWIKPEGQPWQFLQRFYLSNNVDVDIRRAFKIKGLPLNYYQVELRPVEEPNDARRRSPSDHGIYKLGELGAFTTWNVGTIGASTVQMEAQLEDQPSLEAIVKACDFEGIFDDPDDDADMDEDELDGRKRQVCTQQGPVLRITTINEIVNGTANPYPGIVLAKVVIKASERMQSPPTPSFLIRKGTIDRIHLAAGIAAVTNAVTCNDPTANFDADGIQLGDIIRNLDTYQEGIITARVATAVASSIGWTAGDRYLIYRKDSSCYFPDIYASRLGSSYGLGVIFNTDEFLDYPSFVRARKFCVARRFFWDGKIKDDLKINQWAQQEAPGSLLLCSIIDGMRAIVPEEATPPQMLFTAANATDWKESTIDFTKRLYNKVVVTFTDGDDDYKLKTTVIQTPDAYHGRVQPYEESLSLPNATYRQQAQYAGALLLKSRLIQDRTASWNTGLYGASLRPGGLVHAQHTITEWLDERSGFILAVTPNGPGGWLLTVDFPVPPNVTRSSYRATIQYRATGTVDYDIPAATNSSAQFNVGLAGPSQTPQPGDWIALGEDREERRTFRVSAVEPGESIGDLSVSAIYWNKDILTLDGLYIDNVCFGASSGSSVINDAEMRSWLAGMNTWLATYTRNTAPSVMNANYMLANAFHDVLGRGGYFPPASGTSEGQFLMIKACALAFKMTGDEAWRQRAINMANSAIQYLYSPAAIPTNTEAIWQGPHWLFISKADTITKGPIANKPINSGYFNVTINFTNGVGVIPSGGSTRGQLLSNVYAVYATSGFLLWQNIYSPVVGGATYAIDYWVSNFMLGGQNYRVFPTTESSAGTLPVLTGEAAGTIKLTSNFTGSLKLVYAVYEPGTIATRNAKIEAYPLWRLTQPTEINIATDTFPWAWEAYHELFVITNDTQWLRAREATRYTAVQAAAITNLSHYYKTSDAIDPFVYPGSQMVIVNRPTSAVTASRVTSGDKKDWVRLDIAAASAGSFPSVEIQNFAVQTQVEEGVSIRTEAATSITTMLEVVLSLNPDAFNFTQLYKAYWLVPGSGTPSEKLFDGDDFINWDSSIADGKIVWHPAIVDNPVYTYDGAGGTASAEREQIRLGGLSPVIWKINLDGGDGYAGAGFVFSGFGANTNNPPCLYLNHTGDNVILRITDASGRKWDATIGETDGWVRYDRDWSDFRRASTESGDEDPNTTGNIQAIELQASGNGESITRVYYITKRVDDRPNSLPKPSIAYKAALVSKVTSAHTFWVGNFRPVGNPLDSLPFVPGIFPFTLNFLNSGVDAWRGVPYVGYQSPLFWLNLGLTEYLNNTLQFISAAQDAYFLANGIDFAAAPVFSWKYWDAGEYQNNNGGFGWQGSDPNSEWGQYWYRALQETAVAFYKNPSLAIAERIVMRSLTYLYDLYNSRQSGQPPTNIREGVAPLILYHDPAAAAIILRSALYANVSGADPTITYSVLEWSYKYLQTQWIGSGAMAGSFTAGQPTFSGTFRESFGFWHAECILAVAELIRLRSQLRFPCG